MTASKTRFKFRKPREIVLTFRVSPTEKQRLDDDCGEMGQSDYIRTRLFNYAASRIRAKQTIPKVFREIRYELKQIGNNLNQQTRAINEALKTQLCPMSDQTDEYLATLDQVRELIQQTCLEIANLGSAFEEDEGEPG